jgi:heme/copper-type cytochrome/quinol oxidase subunit 2
VTSNDPPFEQSGGSVTKFAKHSLFSVFIAMLMSLGLFVARSGSLLAQEQHVQVIELTAKKYEYSPSPIHVKSGTKVQLRISAVDHDHGFRISVVPDGAELSGKAGLIFSAPQDCVLLKKGEITTIEFLAQMPGTYPFRCCHTCGLGHRGMKNQIVVD